MGKMNMIIIIDGHCTYDDRRAKMWYCERCGAHYVPGEQVYCSYCGTELTEAEE